MITNYFCLRLTYPVSYMNKKKVHVKRKTGWIKNNFSLSLRTEDVRDTKTGINQIASEIIGQEFCK